MSSNELGAFLRTCRANVAPESIGLTSLARGRRVPGLRREEVAQLAGVSVDYYTRLEQGRHTHPSQAVIEAIARALGLDSAARSHLSDLARLDLGRETHAIKELPTVQRIRPALHQVLDTLVDHPAFVLGRRTDILASNALARQLMADWDKLPIRERNMTRWTLLDPRAKEVYEDWEQIASEVVGTLRLDAGRHPEDPLLNQLVGELAIKSPEFRKWWQDRRVTQRTHGTKKMRHQTVGSITIQYEALVLPGDPDQTLFIYSTQPGSPSHDSMRLLASWHVDSGPNFTATSIQQAPAREDTGTAPND